MTGSEASEPLQRAWVATIMAIQDVLGSVKNKALDAVAPLAPMVLPLVTQAFEIYGDLTQACIQKKGFVSIAQQGQPSNFETKLQSK